MNTHPKLKLIFDANISFHNLSENYLLMIETSTTSRSLTDDGAFTVSGTLGRDIEDPVFSNVGVDGPFFLLPNMNPKNVLFFSSLGTELGTRDAFIDIIFTHIYYKRIYLTSKDNLLIEKNSNK